VALAGDREQEGGRVVSETQNFWAAFDLGGECGADLRGCGRLFCACCGAIGALDYRGCCGHGRGMGSPLFLLPCNCPLGGGTNFGDSIRVLHRGRDWESGRLACWTAVGVRASSFFWSADGEGLDGKGQPDCESDYVVCGSDFFRRCANVGRVLGVALGCAVEQIVFSGCAGLGDGNIGE
jgi:hypothetical protein